MNDGCTDSSSQIIEKYAAFDSRLKVVNQENMGLSAARNSGIRISTGEYLMFVDGDDWIDLNTCEYAVSKAINVNADVVLWSYVREYGEGKALKKSIFDEDSFFDERECKNLHCRLFGLSGNQLRNPEHANSLVTACGKLFKTKIIKDNDIVFIDTEIIGTEDALFNIYVFNYVKAAFYIHQYFYHYRRNNPNSLTRTYKPILLDQWICLFEHMQIAISEFCLDKSFETALNNRIALSVIGLGLNECNSPNSNSEQIERLSDILKQEQFRIAIKNLPLKYFSIHWKLFFICAKYNWSELLWVLLKIISRIIKR